MEEMKRGNMMQPHAQKIKTFGMDIVIYHVIKLE